MLYAFAFTPSADLLPGPFVLLLLLPSLPLLIFSIGARTPDTSSLPFSSTEVFTTAAVVSIAGAVVLCLAVWPEVGSGISGWAGRGGEVKRGVDGLGVSGAGTMAGTGRERARGRGRAGGRMPVGGARRMSQMSDGVGQVQQGGRMVQRGRHAMQMQDDPQRTVWIPRTQGDRTTYRTHALREAFPHLYSPFRPHAPTALVLIALLLVYLAIIVAHILRLAYAVDPQKPSKSSSSRDSRDKNNERKSGPGSGSGSSSGSSSSMTPWVMAEIKARQTEKDDPSKTVARVAKDGQREKGKLAEREKTMGGEEFKQYRKKKAREREKEIEVLRKKLEELGLPMVGLPEKKEEKGGGGEGASGDGKESGGAGDGEGEGEGEGKGEPGKPWIGKRVTNWFNVPRPPLKETLKKSLYLDAYDDKAKGGMTAEQAKIEMEVFKAETRERARLEALAEIQAREVAGAAGGADAGGAGWMPADPALAQATIAGSAANAERMAARMKAERGG